MLQIILSVLQVEDRQIVSDISCFLMRKVVEQEKSPKSGYHFITIHTIRLSFILVSNSSFVCLSCYVCDVLVLEMLLPRTEGESVL